MNAAVGIVEREIEPFSVCLPEAGVRRLLLRLGRERADGEPWDAAIQYGAPLPALSELFDYWCDEFDLHAAVAGLNRLPLLRAGRAGRELCFVHQRSRSPDARPLLLLHGFFGSPAEFQQLFAGLSESFHVVCPALPGFGLSVADYEPSLADVAASCASLMAALGYERYAVHGSDLGASIAAQLARTAPERVAALHVTGIASLPTDADELASLTVEEKSRLASLCELEQTWQHAFPESGAELLALALSQLAESVGAEQLTSYREQLLCSLSLHLLSGDLEFRARLAAAGRSAQLGSSDTPTCVCEFPLAPPSLRRFAENKQRIAQWREFERGGCLPALEQPGFLLQSLRPFCREFA
jgi:pimeloyl-ACP methyl ester carboxylesterase